MYGTEVVVYKVQDLHTSDWGLQPDSLVKVKEIQ